MDLHAPLTALLRGLWSLDRGTIEPMLEKKKPRGRPPSIDSLLFRGDVAAVVDLVMRSGQTLPAACKSVSERIQRAGYRLPGRRGPKRGDCSDGAGLAA